MANRFPLSSAVIVDAVRTPFGKYRGGLSHIRTDDFAAMPIAELCRRNSDVDPTTIDDVILGDTNGAGEDNRNVARMAALIADLPHAVPGVTVNRLCGSGGEAMIQAARAIAVGELDTVIAGGVESMSRAPYVLPRPDEELARSMNLVGTTVGWRLVNPRFPREWVASLGRCAEIEAVKLGITRTEMDEWAARSHQRAAAAWQGKLHHDYVLPIQARDGLVERDESIRDATSMAVLRRLRPAFSDDGIGTAGNSSPINDGAIATLMMREETAAAQGKEPIARLHASVTTARQPDQFSIAPVDAIRKLLNKTGLSASDIKVWEINEAFASMVLSCLRLLPELAKVADRDVNPNGGAIAIGHPLGASMPRVIIDCARELRRRGGGYGVAAACIGVGLGVAVLIEA